MKKKHSTREETRARIMDKADELFRQFGFSKTTVADIAAELRMSTANIYKFFPSKNAIIQAGAERSLSEKKESLLRVARGKQRAGERIVRVALAIYGFHRECFRHERQIYKLVLAATEENWNCVREFKEFLARIIRELIEEGVRRREFKASNPLATTRILLDCLTWITNPILFQELNPNEVEGRVRAQVRFLEKALS